MGCRPNLVIWGVWGGTPKERKIDMGKPRKYHLTEKEVAEIRKEYLAGKSENSITVERNLNPHLVRGVCHNYLYPSPTYFLSPNKETLIEWAKRLEKGGFSLVETIHIIYKMFGKVLAANTIRRYLGRTDSWKLNNRPYPTTNQGNPETLIKKDQ